MKVYQRWVKKCVSPSEYKAKYEGDRSRTFLEQDMNGVWYATLVAENELSRKNESLIDLNDEELRKLDQYRRSINYRPFPLHKADDDLK